MQPYCILCSDINNMKCARKYPVHVQYFYTYNTGLFEDNQTVAVTQWTPFTGIGSELVDPIQVDTATLSDAQPSSIPVSQTSPKLCKEFMESTCGCKKFKGKPCSSLFPLDHYIDLRAQSSLLTHDELDLTLLVYSFNR